MEQSPLTHQPRPEVFKPKIVQLYEALFKEEDDDEDGLLASPTSPSPSEAGSERGKKTRSWLSEGFWAEFFLLRPERAALRRILADIPPGHLLELEARTRQLFARAVGVLRRAGSSTGGAGATGATSAGGRGDADVHALDTLSTFLSVVLAKRYTNPSSDIIALLAGLDQVDTVFAEFVGSLDWIIRNGRSLDVRQKAVEVALAVTSGAYQTSILTYFIQRDLFPALMKFVQEADSPARAFGPFTLVGLLANYNKFEFQNPYQLRLADFVNEATIQAIIRSVGGACQGLRADYVDVQDDAPEGWTLASALGMIGLRAIVDSGPRPVQKPVYDAETARGMFAKLPGEEAAILLATYDFTHANKLFAFNLVTLPAAAKGEETPFASFISLTSYLLQHAHLSERTTLYSHLSLMVFRLLIEDPVLCKRMCSDEGKTAVRLCRQRQPHLPAARGERPLAASVMDAMVDGVNHNLRRRLDVGLYTLCVGILLRVVSYMSRSRTRLQYHWAELFRSLLSLVRFLTTYAADLRGLPQVETLLDLVVNLLALGLSSGESFLPTPAAYDDLFYKVVEAGELLVKFRDTYRLASRPSNSIDTLVSVSAHYKEMLASGGASGGKGGRIKGSANTLTSLQVAEVIKQGYETLSIQAKEGLDSWEKYREADERSLLKRMARAAVADVRILVEE